MAGVRKDETWAADRELSKSMCDIDGEPEEERFVAMSAEAEAPLLELHGSAGDPT